MTTPATGSGRPSAIHRSRGFSCLIVAGLLAVGSLPAMAADAGDPLDLSPSLLAPLADSALQNPLAISGRSVMFARDIHAIFNDAPVPGETAQDIAETPKEGRIRTMLKRALALLGTPYRWGGTNPESGFDCSGLVGYVFRNSLGIELPRISRDMANVGELIRDRDALVEGDLVFFSRRGKHVDHVGIYIGNGQFVHAPRTGKDVEVANIATGYWSQKFLQARRVATQ
ncbi:C40 family peptidase [Lysobacter hankyongensis]|uniref:C40 family peptidase n=1 Tax=Lysobacter hankyongensis TaxID=1176535 RepID=A0ABP9B865_9GAMM